MFIVRDTDGQGREEDVHQMFSKETLAQLENCMLSSIMAPYYFYVIYTGFLDYQSERFFGGHKRRWDQIPQYSLIYNRKKYTIKENRALYISS